MKRLWVLLLICLLPVQVFAAVLTYASSVAATDFTESTISMVAKLANPSASDAASAAVDSDIHHDAVADAGNLSSDDENTSYSDSSEDFSTHAGIGDEPVLIQSLAVLPDQPTLAPALRSDNASQPPFLPLAGRPPRV